MFQDNSGEVNENRVIVKEFKTMDRLNARGYGVKEKTQLVLDLYEALLLTEISSFKPFKSKKEISFQDLADYAEKKEKNFYNKYLVFADLRKRGYLTKTGLKFGFDFRVYPKEKTMDEEHSKYVVQVVTENELFKMNEFTRMTRMSQTLKTIVLMAVVDNDSNISYYATERVLL